MMGERNVAIVTGASSGIGAATAAELAKRGYAVVLAARRVERLEEVAARCRSLGGEPLVVPTDVAKMDQVEALVNKTMDAFGRIDVMVNNAGYGLFSRIHETADQDMRAIFDVNYHGLFYGCKFVAPIMIRQRRGHIFNVSSVIGKRGAPFHGAYSATKFAVAGLTDALRVEMKPYHVRVTCVCPATTDTEFFVASPRAREAGSSWVRFRPKTPPEVVARKIVRAIGKGRPEIVVTAGGKFLVILSALWPRAADAVMKLYHDDLARRL